MIAKRLLDIFLSLLGLWLIWPVLLLIAILIKIKMPGGPVIFQQKRVGQNGKLFTMYKFRSMSVGHGGSSVSVKGESRITPLGKKLRAYKLDELPELWNVLIGDMSFVGPRPDVPGYADQLKGKDRDILKLKPGITGPASLKYKNEEEILAQQKDPIHYNDTVIYPDKIRINLLYLERHNLVLDLQLIVQTVIGGFDKNEW
ncbi:sugar transferase [Brumimicrobium aurantiacum]|uniref:Sugar transferase n=1 Tax=Brumimicrobium aurantiacum TaxID=1737063 RepID=A0A3E1F0K3_9FLAO|nr:sugar transferase [Brumimicrobium aurantiacum]RFC55325.1 sugar transferase [Brumimicrobium aurantiacum]